ncbi:hypothetical protein GGR26_000880 [Lewinella marina]|uniref:Uncharacterized protein n=1 Tax=Neolewinella marina TaxID=438751 RepID=A0A2G0CIJ0_9BACT|nr:hypothetical protein [Neolewinella marina]NJB85135.1 hypothetical protein [Neolewinella marina]PHK99730.1 hypothetical protein CGL56_01380 [Neolewinella marina]
MYELNDTYKAHLDAIADAIQASPILAQYLEEEEDEYYEALKAEFEPQIEAAHEQINHYSPFEIESFERYLLDDRFEGLFLPRVLGYSVLRPQINEHYYYTRQNDHFGQVLNYIAGNMNFDQLRSRIGQAVQVGFALSSDIYVTGLVDAIPTKRVRQFLLQQKSDDARTAAGRKQIYDRYKRQFKSRNYQYAPFPVEPVELISHTDHMVNFLLYRVSNAELNNDALPAPLFEFATNPDFAGRRELIEPVLIYGAYLTPEEETKDAIVEVMNRERKDNGDRVTSQVMNFILRLKNDPTVTFGPEQELALGTIIDRSIDDELTAYFNLTDRIHGEGYTEPEVQEAIQEEVLKHDGLSDFNENIRQSILVYFDRLATSLGTDDYNEWYSVTGKHFPVYMKIFANEQFNQELRRLAIRYTKRLIKVHTNKRGKDYRDIKKTTVSTWTDYNFMNEKQLKEFFKTPRKRKKTES